MYHDINGFQSEVNFSCESRTKGKDANRPYNKYNIIVYGIAELEFKQFRLEKVN